MHNTFANLHRWLQIGISHEALVRSLRKTDFINWQRLSYLPVYKLSAYNKELTCAESFCTLSPSYRHCGRPTLMLSCHIHIATESPSREEQHDTKRNLIQ